MLRSTKCILTACLCFWIFPTSWAATYTAASCSASDFQSAINPAKDGDTVQGPLNGGSSTWSANVTLSKGITLNGNGCVITANGYQVIATVDTAAMTRVTNFSFQGCGPGCDAFVKMQGITSSTAVCEVDNNSFNDVSDQGTGPTQLHLEHNGACLVTNNTFTIHHSAAEIIQPFGSTGPTDFSGWQSSLTPGSGSFFYIENNTFTDATNNSWSRIEGYYGAQQVIRYNHFYNVAPQDHGSSPGTCTGNGGENGGRWSEIYNNDFHSVNNVGFQLKFRGGSGLVFNNTLAGSGSVTMVFDEDCSSGTWPLQAQVGRGYTPGASGNSSNHSGGVSGNYNPLYLWNNTGAWNPSTGTSFVAIGASPTDSACTHPGATGNACDVVSTSTQASSLLRCESSSDTGCVTGTTGAGGFSYVYTPYTYPYPLTSAGNPTPPVALQAVVH